MILYPSSTASAIFLYVALSLFFSLPFRTLITSLVCSAGIFTVSVWNGASYYVEVFGRRFEKELVSLRRELEDLKSTEQAIAQDKSQASSTSQQQHTTDADQAEDVPPSEMPITASAEEKKVQ